MDAPRSATPNLQGECAAGQDGRQNRLLAAGVAVSHPAPDKSGHVRADAMQSSHVHKLVRRSSTLQLSIAANTNVQNGCPCLILQHSTNIIAPCETSPVGTWSTCTQSSAMNLLLAPLRQEQSGQSNLLLSTPHLRPSSGDLARALHHAHQKVLDVKALSRVGTTKAPLQHTNSPLCHPHPRVTFSQV